MYAINDQKTWYAQYIRLIQKVDIDIHTVIVWFKALPQLMLNRERGKGWKNPDTIPMPTKCDFPVSQIKQLIVTTWLYYVLYVQPAANETT